MFAEDAADPGYVYVLSNESMPDLLKVGKSNNVADRAAQLSAASGVPTPFCIEYACFANDAAKAEAMCHLRLGGYRINDRREFFHSGLLLTIKVVAEVCLREWHHFVVEDSASCITSEYIQGTSNDTGIARSDVVELFEYLPDAAWYAAAAMMKAKRGVNLSPQRLGMD